MSEEKPVPGKGRSGNKDISPILRGWEYEPGTINVRKVVGLDGQPKLQMRLDLGVMQMEVTGRPDGQRPHGCESLLEYHEARLKAHEQRNGTPLGFHLSPEDCQFLRDEAGMYYQRYLSLFVLGEYAGVARDTARNLRVLDLCGQYAEEEEDRLILEQYRPYIVMMNARSRASMAAQRGDIHRAVGLVRKGLRTIKAFFEKFEQPQAYRHSSEVKVLKRFGRELRGKLPVDPLRNLQRQLKRAVQDERYEEAARLRDEIEKMTQGPAA